MVRKYDYKIRFNDNPLLIVCTSAKNKDFALAVAAKWLGINFPDTRILEIEISRLTKTKKEK